VVGGVTDGIARILTGLGITLVGIVMLLAFVTMVVRRRTSA
jgi:hypothetical protein